MRNWAANVVALYFNDERVKMARAFLAAW
jgi:hypothetical protein